MSFNYQHYEPKLRKETKWQRSKENYKKGNMQVAKFKHLPPFPSS